MNKLNKLWPVILTLAIIAVVLMGFQFIRLRLEAPDFVSITDAQERRETFFNYFNRKIQKLNRKVLEDREKIEQLAAIQSLSDEKRNWLKAKAAQYGVSGEFSPDFFERLLSHVDALPPALVLTQGALESDWGTSRYVVEGNNFFGQKCFYKDCGIAPKNQTPGQKFEFLVFAGPFDSVNAYMFNINTHEAYAKLRAIRAEIRKNGETVTGYKLAGGLEHYSERGPDYVREIRTFIRSNRLDETYPVAGKTPGP